MPYSLEQVKTMLNKAGVTDLFGTRKEVKSLPEILHDGELIIYATSGFMDGKSATSSQGGSPWSGSSNSGTALVVLTDNRIMFIDKGMLYGIRFADIPIEKINGVSYAKKLMFGDVMVTHGAHTILIKNVDKKTASILVEKIKEQMDRIKHQSVPTKDSIGSNHKTPVEQVKEYKELLDMNIITKAEFEKKKKEILGL